MVPTPLTWDVATMANGSTSIVAVPLTGWPPGWRPAVHISGEPPEPETPQVVVVVVGEDVPACCPPKL
jgi:hypothetical protein